jgi:hypothetical protein
MLYLFRLVYINLPHCKLILATQHQTNTNKPSIPQSMAIVLWLQGGYNTRHRKVCRDGNQHKGKLGVSIFRSGTVNEHVLVIRPFTTRSRWRGWRHMLAHPERRTDRARQGRPSRIGGSVLPEWCSLLLLCSKRHMPRRKPTVTVGLVRQLIFWSHDSAFCMDKVSLISGQLHSGLAPTVFIELNAASHASRMGALLVAQLVQG